MATINGYEGNILVAATARSKQSVNAPKIADSQSLLKRLEYELMALMVTSCKHEYHLQCILEGGWKKGPLTSS